MVLSQGNFFADDNGSNQLVEQLQVLRAQHISFHIISYRMSCAQAQNRRLKKRVDKLQTLNNTLKTDMAKIQRENAKVAELKEEMRSMKRKMAEIDTAHKKAIQDKDREIRKLKLNKERLQTERIKISQEFEEKIKVLETQNSQRNMAYGDDQEILDAIEECGDDVDQLKQMLLSSNDL